MSNKLKYEDIICTCGHNHLDICWHCGCSGFKPKPNFIKYIEEFKQGNPTPDK